MDAKLLENLGKSAGLAGISIGIVLLIFRAVLKKNIFPKLNNDQAYALIRQLIYLTFIIGTIGIIAWAFKDNAGHLITGHIVDRDTKKPVSYAEITLSGRPESAQTDGAGNFILSITNSVPSGPVRLFVSKDGYQEFDRNATLGENLEAELVPIKSEALNSTSPVASSDTNQVEIHRREEISSQLNVGEDVSSIAFSADGKLLAAGTYGNSIKLWELKSGTETPPSTGIPAVGSGIQSVALSTNWLAAGGFDKRLRVYKVAGISESPKLTMQPDQDGDVYAVALCRDGHLLASGTTRGTVTLWRERGGIWEPRRLYTHAAPVNSIAFSADGHLLASGSSDKTIKVWDIANGEEIDSPQHHYFARVSGGKVAGVAFNPDGTKLASASWDNSVRIWNITSRQEVGSPFFFSASCYAVAFSADGRWLASGCADNTVTVWDTTNWIKHVVGLHDKRVTSVAFGPDAAHWLASASVDQTIRFWAQPQ